MLQRLDENPLLTPEGVSPTREGLEVMCTLNPAAVRFGEEILLLVRVGEKTIDEPGYIDYLYFDADDGDVKVGRFSRDDPDLECPDTRWYRYRGRRVLTSLSHLRLARSRDGKHFTFDPEPFLFPATPYEAYGCEDARITKIDETYYITYTAVSDRGVTVALASTCDFASFERHGIIFPPFQKDVVLFPEKVRGQYVCRHRPYKSEFNPACIWTAYSPDLYCWGKHEQTLAPNPDTWEANRVGAGANPIKTPDGWLEMYHAADAQGRYAIGAMLSDLDSPERIVSKTHEPIFKPAANYELQGVYHNCVFHNGLVVDDDGTLRFYYGAADRICAGALTTVKEMIAAAKNE